MATTLLSSICSNLPSHHHHSLFSQVGISRQTRNVGGIVLAREYPSGSLVFSCREISRQLTSRLNAVGPGLEATITEKKKNDLLLDNVKIVVESRDEDYIDLRVDLTGDQTQKAFDVALRNLARTAPPIPGFRRTKGGKTSNVPKSFLLQILGEDRVTNFLIQEIVRITVGDYVDQEKLTVKKQFKTIQSSEELKSAFTPGSEFGFNATIEIESLESSDPEATNTSTSESPDSETTNTSTSESSDSEATNTSLSET